MLFVRDGVRTSITLPVAGVPDMHWPRTALGVRFSGSAYQHGEDKQPEKCFSNLATAVVYARYREKVGGRVRADDAY